MKSHDKAFVISHQCKAVKLFFSIPEPLEQNLFGFTFLAILRFKERAVLQSAGGTDCATALQRNIQYIES